MNQYKTQLEDEKKLLESELAGLGRKDHDTGDWEAMPESQTAPEADPNDQADRAEGYEERSATTSVLDARLADINHALAKIEAGNYGVCEKCGMNIEEDRLHANPAARTCKMCMEKI